MAVLFFTILTIFNNKNIVEKQLFTLFIKSEILNLNQMPMT